MVTEGMPEDTRQRLSDARNAVGPLDTLAIVVPIVVLVLVGLLYLLSSVPTAALWTGVAGLFTGVSGYLGAEVGETRLEAAFAENAPQSGAEGDIANAAFGFVEGGLGQLAAQSLWLTAIGGLLVITGAVLRFGLLEDYIGSSEEERGGLTDEPDHAASEAPDATSTTPGAAPAGDEGSTPADTTAGDRGGDGDIQEPVDGSGDGAGEPTGENSDAAVDSDDEDADPDDKR
jgi:hypothetical protein